jgi:hypothetical protein
MQQMGETREPMASDCWSDAQRLALKYSKSLKHDFWILYAAKPHTQNRQAIVAGWEVIAKRPPQGMVGVLVFKWCHLEERLEVDHELSLPYDVPLSDLELSTSAKDIVTTVGDAGRRSGSILLA